MSASDSPKGLGRTLTWEDGLATFLGTTLGVGLLVVALPAARVLGPAAPLGFVLSLPVAISTAACFAVYLSGPLGDHPGGMYRHVSRTWRSPLAGFVVGWMAWGSYLALLATLSLWIGDAVSVVSPLATLPAWAWAITFLTALAALQIAGTDLFGWAQTAATALLVGLLAVLLATGLLAIDPANFDPLFPNQLYGSSFGGRLLAATSVFLVTYVGLDVVAQVAGETDHSRSVLPRITLAGVTLSLVVFAAVTTVVLGTIPWWQLVEVSRRPLADAAAIYLPTRASWLVVAVGLLAAATTANAVLSAASRLLVAFGRDLLLPGQVAGVHTNLRTPTTGTLVCYGCSASLVLLGTAELAGRVAVGGLALSYLVHSLSAVALPFANRGLFERRGWRVKPAVLALAGTISSLALGVVAWYATDPSSALLAFRQFGEGSVSAAIASSPLLAVSCWTVAGALIVVRYRAYLRHRGTEVDDERSFESELQAERYGRPKGKR